MPTSGSLLPSQAEGLAARFPLFDAERCASYFSEEQPDGGQFRVRGQGDFPAVRMANGVHWFYKQDQRPTLPPNARGELPPMKAKAPRGVRHLLVDDQSAAELLVVEGEGHGLALTSVGFSGVVVVGGTQALLSNAGDARARRVNVFRGKAVRILFDTDAAGRAGATRAAAAISEAGASRVAIIEAPFEPGVDVEDWLATWPTAERALGQLLGLVGSAQWLTTEEARGEEAAEARTQFVQSRSIHGQGGEQYLAVTVWDKDVNAPSLAVIGGPGGQTPQASTSVGHDEVTLGAGWALMEQWAFEGTTYAPDLRGDMMKQIRSKSIVMPAPPAEPGSSRQLWIDTRDFIATWVSLEPRYYNLLTAYVFMTYRLRDAGFEYVPYVRFHGPPGTGKGRALDVMRSLVYRGLSTKPTKGNLHRVIDFYGDATLLIDEFHLDRGWATNNEELIDLLNQGNKLGESLPRVHTERDGSMVIRVFEVFGPKILAGYGSDEHEALARRSVTVPMGSTDVPEAMKLFCLPETFYEASYQLRARFLGWRGRKLALGQPAHSERHRQLLASAGHEVGQVFWPLVEMVPKDLPEALDDVLACAAGRKQATAESREAGPSADMLEAVATLWGQGRHLELAGKAGTATRLILTRDLAEHLGLQGPGAWKEIVAILRTLGLQHGRPRLAAGGQLSGIVIDPQDAAVKRAMARYGIEWPPASTAEDPGL